MPFDDAAPLSAKKVLDALAILHEMKQVDPPVLYTSEATAHDLAGCFYDKTGSRITLSPLQQEDGELKAATHLTAFLNPVTQTTVEVHVQEGYPDNELCYTDPDEPRIHPSLFYTAHMASSQK